MLVISMKSTKYFFQDSMNGSKYDKVDYFGNADDAESEEKA